MAKWVGPNEFPRWLRAWLADPQHKAAGWTQKRLAAEIGTQQSAVSAWMRPRDPIRPSVETLIRLAGVLPGVELSELLIAAGHEPAPDLEREARRIHDRAADYSAKLRRLSPSARRCAEKVIDALLSDASAFAYA